MKSVRAKTSSIGFFIGALILLCAWAIQAFDKQHAARDDRIAVLIVFICSVGYLLSKLYRHTKRRRDYASHDRT